MGSEENAPETAPDEWPAHRVHRDSFAIDVHEVSNRCYEGFVKAGGVRGEPVLEPGRMGVACAGEDHETGLLG